MKRSSVHPLVVSLPLLSLSIQVELFISHWRLFVISEHAKSTSIDSPVWLPAFPSENDHDRSSISWTDRCARRFFNHRYTFDSIVEHEGNYTFILDLLHYLPDASSLVFCLTNISALSSREKIALPDKSSFVFFYQSEGFYCSKTPRKMNG